MLFCDLTISSMTTDLFFAEGTPRRSVLRDAVGTSPDKNIGTRNDNLVGVTEPRELRLSSGL